MKHYVIVCRDTRYNNNEWYRINTKFETKEEAERTVRYFKVSGDSSLTEYVIIPENEQC